MIDWMLEAEDIACPVDDMKIADCSRSFVQLQKGCVLKEQRTTVQRPRHDLTVHIGSRRQTAQGRGPFGAR
jgi:hypothetical protein